MKRKELDALKARIREKQTKATDLDILVEKILALPPGQLKKILTDDVLAILAKYGYTEG
jgi:hypothetical protein